MHITWWTIIIIKERVDSQVRRFVYTLRHIFRYSRDQNATRAHNYRKSFFLLSAEFRGKNRFVSRKNTCVIMHVFAPRAVGRKL